MKILHIIPVLGCGGAEILLGRIALHQKQSGHEVLIVTLYQPHATFEHYPDREKLENEIPIKVTPSRVKLLKQNKSIWLEDWKRVVTDFSPDVIHAHLYEADLVAHSILLPGVVYITHVHGPVFPLEKKEKLPFSKREIYEVIEKKWLYRQYRVSNSGFIAISNATSDYTKTIIPADLHSRIEIIHNGIEPEKFKPRRRIHVAQPVKLVTTGNLVAKKNHSFIVNVVKFLTDAGYNCQLDILGYGILEPDIRKLISLYNLDNKIMLRGSVGNVVDYLNYADIYLHAAIPEPFGLAIIEAMANGLPVVTVDGGGNRDFVEESINGFIVSDLNIALFAEKIITLIDHPDHYAAMGIAAIKTAGKFSFKVYASRLSGFYEKLIKMNNITE